MNREDDNKNAAYVETGGGTFIEGNVSTGRDFAGRDINIVTVIQPLTPENTTRRNLELRKRMRDELITSSAYWQEIGYHPHPFVTG